MGDDLPGEDGEGLQDGAADGLQAGMQHRLQELLPDSQPTGEELQAKAEAKASKLTPTFQVCTEQYRQESQPYSETECQTTYERQCESTWQTDGYGGKQWVEVPSTCQNQPQKSCNEVTKQNLVQVRRE